MGFSLNLHMEGGPAYWVGLKRHPGVGVIENLDLEYPDSQVSDRSIINHRHHHADVILELYHSGCLPYHAAVADSSCAL